MKKIMLLALALLLPNISYALPTPAQFLSHNSMPLLVRVANDSDFRIKLQRDETVTAENESYGIVKGNWKATDTDLLISYTVSKQDKPTVKKELKYSLKLVPDAKLASGGELLIEGKSLVFTHREEHILDVNVPEVPAALKAKCQKVLSSVANASLSQGKEAPFAGPSTGIYKVEKGMLHGVYQKRGLILEASIGLVSSTHWDCLFYASFLVDLNKKTCGLVRYELHHCAN